MFQSVHFEPLRAKLLRGQAVLCVNLVKLIEMPVRLPQLLENEDLYNANMCLMEKKI